MLGLGGGSARVGRGSTRVGRNETLGLGGGSEVGRGKC